MNYNHHIGLSITAGLLTAFLAVSCSIEDRDAATDGIPLSVAASISGISTRSATATTSSWTVGDIVALQDGTTAHKYLVNDASSGAMSGDLFFEPGVDSKQITGWSYGGSDYEGLLQLLSAAAAPVTQNTAATFQNADFLYAPAATATPAAMAQLTFAHEMTRILILVKNTNAQVAVGDITISGVQIQAKNKASFTADAGWTMDNDADYNTFLPLQGTQDGYLSSYSALIIPQDMSGTAFLRFAASVAGVSEGFTYTPGKGKAKFDPSIQYIFEISFNYSNNITIKEVLANNWNETTSGTIVDQVELVKVNGAWTAATPGGSAMEQTTSVIGSPWTAGSGGSTTNQNENPNANGKWNGSGSGGGTNEQTSTITVGGWTATAGGTIIGGQESANATGHWNDSKNGGNTSEQTNSTNGGNWTTVAPGSSTAQSEKPTAWGNWGNSASGGYTQEQTNGTNSGNWNGTDNGSANNQNEHPNGSGTWGGSTNGGNTSQQTNGTNAGNWNGTGTGNSNNQNEKPNGSGTWGGSTNGGNTSEQTNGTNAGNWNGTGTGNSNNQNEKPNTSSTWGNPTDGGTITETPVNPS